MVTLISYTACPHCGNGAANRDLGTPQWHCAMCGAPMQNRDSALAVLRHTLYDQWGWFKFEVKLGKLSRYRLVRWLSR